MKEIYFAGGCFWGVQRYFDQLDGVISTTVGYANGNSETATYPSLKTTMHAETVHIQYDESIITLKTLLLHFYRIIDPTTLNRQSNDIGIQYRSGIYYVDESDYHEIMAINTYIEKLYQITSVVEILPLVHYILAEDYHQNYLIKNPNGYCHIPSSSAKEILIDPTLYTKDLTNLSDLSIAVTQHKATEKPFENEFDLHFEEGIYVDITTGEPLFFSKDKFTSGCGWPAFSKSISQDVVKFKTDTSYNMERIEVLSRVGDAHLGHVFNDGPFGTRYCINSASLRFIPKSQMQQLGYGHLLKYV